MSSAFLVLPFPRCTSCPRIHNTTRASTPAPVPESHTPAPLCLTSSAHVTTTPGAQLAEDFGLLVQTGGLACNYFDRYLSTVLARGGASKRSLQMIASTCLLIAAKFFDRKLPPLSELEVVHNGTVRSEQFAVLETAILDAIGWQLHVPLPHAFIELLRACVPGAPFNSAIEERMLFFIDLSVYGYHLLVYTSAEISAGALLASWTFSNEHDAVVDLLGVLAHACSTEAARLSGCANDLVRYYQACFPEAAKSYQSLSLFLPISDEAHATKEPPGRVSPDSVLAPLS